MVDHKKSEEDRARLNADLVKAVKGVRLHAARYLVENGADFSLQDADGNTILHQLAATPHYNPKKMRNGLSEFVKSVVSRSLDINAVNKAGKTPLHIAASNPQDV